MAGFKAFSQKGSPSNKPKRNVFDLSFTNNLTMKFGTLYPVFCKEVIPGDSFKIDPVFALRLMPMVFPTMTRMKANLHFFYVRNRNLWKDWPDFIGRTKEGLTPPYLSGTSTSLGVGTLGDYLGLPSVIYNSLGFRGSSYRFNCTSISPANDTVPPSGMPVTGLSPYRFFYFTLDTSLYQSASSSDVVLRFPAISATSSKSNPNVNITIWQDGSLIGRVYKGYVPSASFPERAFTKSQLDSYLNGHSGIVQIMYQIEIADSEADVFSGSVAYYFSNFTTFTASSLRESFNLNISALPFRAYESIYNAIYRNDQNNPRIVNGSPVYNKYVSVDGGSADGTAYSLFQANWENDMFTTAVQSPQQGVAPLVGISSTGVATFANEDGTTTNVQLDVDSDGETIVGFQSKENLPQGTVRSLISLASEGISINDFRNVNALQKWLETNIRKGYKYKDQIKSHFGVDVSYAELDMPEFIGGMSRNIVMNDITQTSATGINGSDSPLGSWAGNGSCFGGSDHSITHYCDEHGFIMGVMYISPVPNYPQALDRFWIKSDPFDYYFPEFGHIGMQPIQNKLVAPLQGTAASNEEVFGYQRSWYEYLGSLDQVHGDFLTSLDNYVIQRHFEEQPKLGADFTTINDATAYQIFADQSVNDKVLGQIYFNVTAKRPIPMFGDPTII